MAKAKDTGMISHVNRGTTPIDSEEDYIHPVTGEHIIPKYEAFCTSYTTYFDPKRAMQDSGYPVEERRHDTMLRAFRVAMARKDVQLRIRGLIREKADHSGIGPDWIVMKWMELLDRCMQAEPVLDNEGNPTGEWKFDSRGANNVLENLAKYFGMFHKESSEGRKIELHVNYGPPPEAKEVQSINGEAKRLN